MIVQLLCYTCAGEVLSQRWARRSDPTPSQVQRGTAAAEWHVFITRRRHCRMSTDGVLSDVVQHCVWQSVSDLWHRTLTCLARSAVVGGSRWHTQCDSDQCGQTGSIADALEW